MGLAIVSDESNQLVGWSSYRSHLLGEVGPVRVNEGWGRISFRRRAA
jgi:hypothetical protein